MSGERFGPLSAVLQTDLRLVARYIDQLRHQATDLLRGATAGDSDSLSRILAVSHRLILASAQLAVARDYGISRWSKLKTEVERRQIFNSRDVSRLSRLLAVQPEPARTKMEHWCEHKCAEPLGYIAMLRVDHRRLGLPRDLPGTGVVARALLDAGAPVDGDPDDAETPLITAASYGEADVARVLIDAGANLGARADANAGGVGGGTAIDACFGVHGEALVMTVVRYRSRSIARSAFSISAVAPMARNRANSSSKCLRAASLSPRSASIWPHMCRTRDSYTTLP